MRAIARHLPLPPRSPPPARRGRSGGYTRVLRCGFRSGDRAPMAIIEYVDRPGEVRPARPGTPPPAPPAPRAAALAARAAPPTQQLR